MASSDRSLRSYLGIDPGTSGALALLHGERLRIYDVPTLTIRKRGSVKTEIDAFGLLETINLIAAVTPGLTAIVEKVGGLPKQSAAGAFQFGRTVGLIEMACVAANVPVVYAAPGAWKAHARLIGKGATYQERKAASRALASEIWPGSAHFFSRVKDDGRADAALLARYGAQNGL